MDSSIYLFPKKLREIRTLYRITQKELAKKMGYHETYISDIERGRTKPSNKFILRISEIFNINPEWLLTGEGEKYPLMVAEQKAQYSTSGEARIPILGYAPAGPPDLQEQQPLGEITVPRSMLPPGKYYAIKAVGDSMSGAHIPDGAIVVIRQTREPHSGEIALIRIGNETTLKRIYIFPTQIILRPENPNYKDLIITPDDFREIQVLGTAHLVLIPLTPTQTRVLPTQK